MRNENEEAGFMIDDTNPKVTWDIRDIVEVLVRALDLQSTGLVLDLKNKCDGGYCYYDDTKTIQFCRKEVILDGIAHEVFHHRQNVLGRNKDRAEKRFSDYDRFSRAMCVPNHRPHFDWAYLSYPWEAEASLFARVFAERYYLYGEKKGVIDHESTEVLMADIKSRTTITDYLPKHKKLVDQLQEWLDKTYIVYCRFSTKIDAALEEILSHPDESRKYSFEIIEP